MVRFWPAPFCAARGAFRHAFIEPEVDLTEEALRRLAAKAGRDGAEGLCRQRIAHRLLRLQHHRVDGAFTGDRPIRRRIVEHCAAPAYLLAIEQRLVPFDGVDDRQKTDLIRRARQPVAAAHPFAGDDDPRLFQLGENLGQKAGEMPCSSASSRLLSARWLSPTSHSRQWMPYSTLVVMYAICPFSTVNEPSITQTI